MSTSHNRLVQQEQDEVRYRIVINTLLPYIRSCGGLVDVKTLWVMLNVTARELTTIVAASRGVLEIGYVYSIREKFVRSAQPADWRDPRCQYLNKITHSRRRTNAG